MGHCSCYGPLCNLYLNAGTSLQELWDSMSDDLKKECRAIYRKAAKFLADKEVTTND